MTDPDIYEFYNLGLGDPIAVSAVHGHGTGDLLDACFDYFPPEEEEEEESDVIKVAVIGKPNVGKSSLINRILRARSGSSSPTWPAPPATRSTRYFENEQRQVPLHRHRRDAQQVQGRGPDREIFRSARGHGHRARGRVPHHDRRQRGRDRAGHQGRGLWRTRRARPASLSSTSGTLVEKDGKTMDRMREDIRRDLSYMTYAPILFISAPTGQRVERLFELINYVHDAGRHAHHHRHAQQPAGRRARRACSRPRTRAAA